MSDSSRELCPAEHQLAPPAIYLQRDLDRVTGVMDLTTIDHEKIRIQGGERLHGATIAYDLRNVEWSDGFLFKGAWKDRLLSTPPTKTGPKESITHGTLSATYFGSRYFGHWITDDLTLNLSAETLGEPVIPARKSYLHEDGYKQLLQLNSRQVNRARFDRLTILEDLGQNTYKKQRYQELRKRAVAHLDPPKGRRIMLHRGGSGVSRLLQNEAEIEGLLNQQGFAIIDPAKLSTRELAEQTAGAEIVLAVEGSQLAHSLLTVADHGVLCAIQPPYRFNNIFKDHADCLGLHYAFITGEAVEGGFRVEPDEMRELVDRLSALV